MSEIEAVIEERDAADDPTNELVWKPIGATRTMLFQNPASPGEWEGDVPLTVPLVPGLFRLTLKEFEWYIIEKNFGASTLARPLRSARLVLKQKLLRSFDSLFES